MNTKARIMRLERIEVQRRQRRQIEASGPALYFASGGLCVAPWAQLSLAELKKSLAAWHAADAKGRP